MNKLRKIFILLLGVMASMQTQAQDKIRRLCADWYLRTYSRR